MTATAPPRRCIDTHHHILPPRYLAQARDRVAAVAGEFAEQVLAWTPAKSIEAMDRAGIGTSVTSISSPGLWFGNARETNRLARECNEFAARLRADHPGRFGVFAALPLPGVEATLAEISYTCEVLNADGYGLFTNYGGTWLGDSAFAPVMDELNRRRAVVFVHPLACPQCAGLLPGVPDAILEYPFDTTRAITSLLYSGTLMRCPDIRFIFSHGGGALPMLAHRIARYAGINKEISKRVSGDAREQLERLFFDMVGMTQRSAFDSLRAFGNVAQLVFGSDYPYWLPEMAVSGLASLGLSNAELAAIHSENALRLLPRLSNNQSAARERTT